MLLENIGLLLAVSPVGGRTGELRLKITANWLLIRASLKLVSHFSKLCDNYPTVSVMYVTSERSVTEMMDADC